MLLLSIHSMGAAITGIEELELEKHEAQAYGDAIKQVAAFYPHHLQPKVMAWLNLCIVAGGIYGTRIMAYRIRTAEKRKQKVVSIGAAGKSNGATQPQPQAPVVPSQIWNAGAADTPPIL